MDRAICILALDRTFFSRVPGLAVNLSGAAVRILTNPRIWSELRRKAGHQRGYATLSKGALSAIRVDHCSFEHTVCAKDSIRKRE